jgi:HAD superfamily hydrolase (TIGR01549 family)
MDIKPVSRHFEAIIFDLGGTLIYFEGSWPEVMAEAGMELHRSLTAAGLDLDQDAFMREFHTQLETYYVERESDYREYTTLYVVQKVLQVWDYLDVDESVIREGLQALYEVTEGHWHVEQDTALTLKTLGDKGYRLGLISNAGDDADVQTLVDNANLRDYFEIIITSAAEGIRKPSPHIFNKMLNFWGIEPSQAAMVGDTLSADILGASKAGLYSIWITRRADTPANQALAAEIIPDATIATLSELPDLLNYQT